MDLYLAEVQSVHALIRRVLGPSEATDDLVQETFMRVFCNLPRYRGDAQLSTWIGRIALNVAYDHVRHRAPPTAPLELVPETSHASVERSVAAREGLRRLYRILDRIDPKQRIAFVLHVVDGRSQREVAELMSATLVATKTRIWRARREVLRAAKRDPGLASFMSDSPAPEPEKETET
jgi:RNA polymerase sigma-70 factor (ECF subfamily)